MPDEDPSFESELEPQQQPSAQLNPEPEQILNSAFGLISEQESDPEDEGSFDKFLREFKSHPLLEQLADFLALVNDLVPVSGDDHFHNPQDAQNDAAVPDFRSRLLPN
jgi:hypothetical protein